MTLPRLLRAEIRSLTTTRLPLWFLATTVLLALAVAAVVLLGAGTDGAVGMFDSLAEQRSLFSFGANALMIAGILGAIVVAGEYAHGMVIPRYLLTPKRHHAVLAQLLALLLAGGVVGLFGGVLTLAAGALTLPLAGFERHIDIDTAARLSLASTLGGAIGAAFGAGIGAVVRNTGGAVAITFGLLILGPVIVAQFVHAAAPWVPGALIETIAGAAAATTVPTAIVALLVWGFVPVVAGTLLVARRDVA